MQKMIVLVLLVGLSTAVSAKQTASLMVYQVWEYGADPYTSRVLVTPDFVRLDEGDSRDGYSLYDRQQEIIYNVVPEERSVMVMSPEAPLPEENPALILQHKVAVDTEAPKVAGRSPKEVRLLANGETCADLVVLEGLMDDALAGLAELKRSLARIHAASLSNTSLGERTPCDLASTIYAPDRSLSFGLPLHERSEGRSQSLVDFSEKFEVDDALFQLPDDFSRRPMFAPLAN